jgi:predicted transcriptional regulator of viral defense system
MSRSLSPLESKLILYLEWEKQPIVTIEDAAQVLNISKAYARKVLQRLTRDKWLAPITAGKYELIPAERGEYAFPDTNPLFIGSHLITPYYFSYSTAGYYHGLTTQASHTVYIATKEGKTRQMMVREELFQIIRQPENHFFGFEDVNAYGSQVMMAYPEKTIIDSLHRPIYSGDIPEIATMIWRGRNSFQLDRLREFALRFNSKSLIQRVGYLVELLAIPGSELFRNELLDSIGSNTCYLGQLSRWGKGGEFSQKWKVVDNVPRNLLMAEIEVVQ